MMLDALRDAPWLLDAVWQSTVLFGAGLAAAALLRRHPARAHAALACAMIAAIVAPLLAQIARARGWGLFAAPAPAFTMGFDPALASRRASIGAGSTETWIALAAALWAAATMTGLARLGLSLARARRMLREATPLCCSRTSSAARAVAARFGLRAAPRLLESPDVDGPVIWCWGRRPAVILPRGSGRTAPMTGPALDAVLSHELAHWRRGDHLWSLLGEVVVCLLPWSPLARWSRRALGRLSEQACDTWALSAGVSRVDFASVLLGIVQNRRQGLVLGAVLNRRALPSRIERILEQPRRDPRTGRGWSAGVAILTLVVATTAALAHRRVAFAADGIDGAPLDAEVLAALAGGPPVAALPGDLDLGEVPPGGAGTGTLWLVNTSGRPVDVRGAKASCGCTTLAGLVTGPLPPGRPMAVTVTMTAPSTPDTEKTKKVTVDVAGQAPLVVAVTLRTSSRID